MVNTMSQMRQVDLGGPCQSPLPCGCRAEVWNEKQSMWLCRKCDVMIMDAHFGMGDHELEIEEIYPCHAKTA